ncbi:MAG: formyltransferase family protein [Candidatus Krumholzibacteriia bacterium]
MDRRAGRGRVTVVTNGNVFAAHALGPLLRAAGDDLDLQVIVTTGLRKPGGNRAGEVWRLWRRWGSRYFTYKAATYVIPVLAEVLGRGPRTVSTLARSLGLPVIVTRNVNRPAAKRLIAEFAPDLILSVSCPYRIKAGVLSIPRLGCLNLHSSLLPAYAGVCTYIHVLAAGEPRTGITLHEMVEEFDAGRIVSQLSLDIRPGTSVCELFGRLCRLAAPMVLREVRAILERQALTGHEQDAGARQYFGEPSREDIAGLRERGFVLMRRSDARALWNQDPGVSSSA